MSLIGFYQLLVGIVCLFSFFLVFQLRSYKKEMEDTFDLLCVVEYERQRLQKKYEGQATPIPKEVFLEYLFPEDVQNVSDEEDV